MSHELSCLGKYLNVLANLSAIVSRYRTLTLKEWTYVFTFKTRLERKVELERKGPTLD